MSNLTGQNSSDLHYEPTFVGEHILYASIGTLVFVSNSTIVAAWAMKKTLRAKKEMVKIKLSVLMVAAAETSVNLQHCLQVP